MRGFALCAGLLVFAAGLAAQGDPRLSRLDPATRTAVAALIDSAHAAGLPTEPLVQRALEGATKRAPADRILAALRRYASDLGSARAAVGTVASHAELEAAAAALYVGARARDLAILRERRPGQSLLVPLAVLTDLVARGVPVDTAAVAVLALAETSADAQYLAFQRNVERDIARGAPPAAAVAVRTTAATTDSPRKP